MFQPDGLRRLFSLPMEELADTAGDGHAVVGAHISQVWQALGNLASFELRLRLVNEFLLHQAALSVAANGISKVISHVVRASGRSDMGELAHQAGLSVRHFTRLFLQQTGVSPKRFARIVRFQAALENKALSARKSWTEIAVDLGYYDQMHMIHDFEQLAGASPKQMLAHLETVFVEPISRFDQMQLTRPVSRMQG